MIGLIGNTDLATIGTPGRSLSYSFHTIQKRPWQTSRKYGSTLMKHRVYFLLVLAPLSLEVIKKQSELKCSSFVTQTTYSTALYEAKQYIHVG